MWNKLDVTRLLDLFSAIAQVLVVVYVLPHDLFAGCVAALILTVSLFLFRGGLRVSSSGG